MKDGSESLGDEVESEHEPVDNPESLEHPATTVYNNIRDLSRREVLGAAGLGLVGYVGWTTDVDGDGMSNGKELLRGRNPIGAGPIADVDSGLGEATPTEEPGVRERALAYAEELEGERYPDLRSRVASFIEDDRVADRFIDEQLQLWLHAPDKIHREGRDFFHLDRKILQHGLLYANDWSMNLKFQR